jgi:hypothetical protein
LGEIAFHEKAGGSQVGLDWIAEILDLAICKRRQQRVLFDFRGQSWGP